MVVNRFMNVAVYHPRNYGYVSHTLSGDGDPVDGLALTPVPVISGAAVACRPLAMLMIDEAGFDAKILAVPDNKLRVSYRHYHHLSDVPQGLLDQIPHFFATIRDLETGKWARIDGWVDGTGMGAEIIDGIERYRSAREKPLLGQSRLFFQDCCGTRSGISIVQAGVAYD